MGCLSSAGLLGGSSSGIKLFAFEDYIYGRVVCDTRHVLPALLTIPEHGFEGVQRRRDGELNSESTVRYSGFICPASLSA